MSPGPLSTVMTAGDWPSRPDRAPFGRASLRVHRPPRTSSGSRLSPAPESWKAVPIAVEELDWSRCVHPPALSSSAAAERLAMMPRLPDHSQPALAAAAVTLVSAGRRRRRARGADGGSAIPSTSHRAANASLPRKNATAASCQPPPTVCEREAVSFRRRLREYLHARRLMGRRPRHCPDQPDVGTLAPAVTSTCSTLCTGLTDVPRSWRARPRRCRRHAWM